MPPCITKFAILFSFILPKDCSLLLSKSEFISDMKPSAPMKIIGPTNNAVGLILLK